MRRRMAGETDGKRGGDVEGWMYCLGSEMLGVSWWLRRVPRAGGYIVIGEIRHPIGNKAWEVPLKAMPSLIKLEVHDLAFHKFK
jgi:hypothetical protein